MKKFIGVLIVLGLVLSSCNALSDSKCRASVESAYPKDEVYSIPGVNYCYLVIDSVGTIRSVKTMNQFNAKISSVNVIKRGK